MRGFYNTPTLLKRELLILREKPLQYFLLPSPIVIPIERRFIPKYNPRPFRVLRVFLEALEDAKDGRCNIELIAGSRKLEKTRLGLTLLEQEAWRAQMHQVDQAWRVYCYSCIPTNFLVDHFIAWRAAERIFAQFFGFLFDNMCRCYLCVCISLTLTLYI